MTLYTLDILQQDWYSGDMNLLSVPYLCAAAAGFCIALSTKTDFTAYGAATVLALVAVISAIERGKERRFPQ